MSEWQPIDTAPQDGSMILLWIEGYHPMTGGWSWYDADSGGWDTRIGFLPFTHWMPLPEPPK